MTDYPVLTFTCDACDETKPNAEFAIVTADVCICADCKELTDTREHEARSIEHEHDARDLYDLHGDDDDVDARIMGEDG